MTLLSCLTGACAGHSDGYRDVYLGSYLVFVLVKPSVKLFHISSHLFNYGPGYRVYYKQVEQKIIVLLVAGDKSSQPRDIRLAQRLAKEY